MAYSHLLVYIYFVFLSIISNFVRLFSPFNTSDLIPLQIVTKNADYPDIYDQVRLSIMSAKRANIPVWVVAINSSIVLSVRS